MTQKIVFTDEDAAKIRRAYDEGATLTQLREQFGMVPTVLRRAVIQAGGKIRRSGRRKGTKNRAKAARPTKAAKAAKAGKGKRGKPKRAKARKAAKARAIRAHRTKSRRRAA